MNNKILVSVIIPYYKKKDFIKKTLDSVLRQSFQNFEVLIVYDDTDKSELNYLRNLINQKKTNKIKILANNKNLGVGRSRNKAIRYSKGKFLAFIDADDIWNKDKLKYQLEFMKKKNCNFTFTSYQIINKFKKVISQRNVPIETNYQELLVDCKIGLSTVILKKNVLNNSLKFPTLKTKEDLVLWLKISKKHRLIGLNKKLTKWRKTENSLSSNVFQKLLDGYRVYNVYLNMNPFKSIFYLILLSINYLKKNVNLIK